MCWDCRSARGSQHLVKTHTHTHTRAYLANAHGQQFFLLRLQQKSDGVVKSDQQHQKIFQKFLFPVLLYKKKIKIKMEEGLMKNGH